MPLSMPIHRLKREAGLLSRAANIPLHDALDRMAAREGFGRWSLLAAHLQPAVTPRSMFARLTPGDLVLVAARPGQGKTLVSLGLAVEAMRSGHRGVFFSLEYTERDVLDRFRTLGVDRGAFGALFSFDGSDDISADYIAGRLATEPPGGLVVDYLQLLDQKRDKPELGEQVRVLRSFAREKGLIIVAISQIDRTYDSSVKPCPDIDDIRLPNPVDLSLFTKTCFINDGNVRFQAMG